MFVSVSEKKGDITQEITGVTHKIYILDEQKRICNKKCKEFESGNYCIISGKIYSFTHIVKRNSNALKGRDRKCPSTKKKIYALKLTYVHILIIWGFSVPEINSHLTESKMIFVNIFYL